MKQAIAMIVALAMFSGGALADPRVEIDQNGSGTYHAPWNADNTDNESKLPVVGAIAFEDDGMRTADVFATSVVQMPKNDVNGNPTKIWALGLAPENPIIITSNESDTPCTAKIDNARYKTDSRTGGSWSAKHVAVGGNRVKVSTFCFNAAKYYK